MKKLLIFIFTSIVIILNSLTVQAEDSSPQIVGHAAITINKATNEILYEKNAYEIMYPASITKLVTAIILAEKKTPDDILTYSEKAKAVEPTKLDLNVNSTISAKDAMNALLMYSANDIAYMIGENISGSEEIFSKLMNKKTEEIGLKTSNFVTPNGLPAPNHFSTAYDLALVGKAAYSYPWIMQTLNRKNAEIISSNKNFNIINSNKLLGKDGCIGGKTGYTEAAGRCLLSMYQRNDTAIIGVVLKSELDKDDTVVFNDMEKIIDYSYTKDQLQKAVNEVFQRLDKQCRCLLNTHTCP